MEKIREFKLFHNIVIDVGASMRQCNAILTVSPNFKVIVY